MATKERIGKFGILVICAILIGIGGGYYADWETGVAAGTGTLLAAGIFMAFFNPPPAGGSGDAGAINFGG